MSYNIAIDGPAGAGKSTIAKLIAKKKNYIYVDTGAMYRAMALYFLEAGISADDQGKIESSVDQIDVTITYENGEQVVWLNGRNVNGLIRTEEVSRMASATSVNPKVRTKLVELQRPTKLRSSNKLYVIPPITRLFRRTIKFSWRLSHQQPPPPLTDQTPDEQCTLLACEEADFPRPFLNRSEDSCSDRSRRSLPRKK